MGGIRTLVVGPSKTLNCINPCAQIPCPRYALDDPRPRYTPNEPWPRYAPEETRFETPITIALTPTRTPRGVPDLDPRFPRRTLPSKLKH